MAAAPDAPKPDGAGALPVSAIIVVNIVSSVALVALNKVLFKTLGFPFVTLLSAAHFFAGFGFLWLASTARFGLFARGAAPEARARVWGLAATGAASIVLSNYSLMLNALGTAQIFKAAVLPVVVVLVLCQDAARAPTPLEGAATLLVVTGSVLSVAGDVTATAVGTAAGLVAVVVTAQFQLWQGSLQKRLGFSAIQLMYAAALPQGVLTLAASVLLETDFKARAAPHGRAGAAPGALDMWTFPFTAVQLVVVLATCTTAIALNWSAFSIIGRTSAVTMQVTTQVKAVFIFAIDFFLFPRPVTAQQLLGNTVCVAGALWYGLLKTSAPPPPATTTK